MPINAFTLTKYKNATLLRLTPYMSWRPLVTDLRTGFLHNPELILAPELETPTATAPAARNLMSEAMPIQAPVGERVSAGDQLTVATHATGILVTVVMGISEQI
jgi:hypothetical protein